MLAKRIVASGIAAFAFLIVAGVPQAQAALSPYYWQQNTVYVENHTSARWPVAAATKVWSDGVKNFTMVSGRCKAGAPCVKVYEGNYGKTGWVGITQLSYRGPYIVGTVTIKLNTYYSWYTATNRRAVTCHELGHAIGAAHNGNSNGSCLYNPAYKYPYPSRTDLAELTKRYAA